MPGWSPMSRTEGGVGKALLNLKEKRLQRPLVFLALLWLLLLIVLSLLGLPLRGARPAERWTRAQPEQAALGLLRGRVLELSENSRGWSILLEGAEFTPQGLDEALQAGRVLVYFPKGEDIRPGNILLFVGKLAFFEGADNPGQFDSKAYYLSLDMALFMEAEAMMKEAEGQAPLRRAALQVRTFLRAGLRQVHPQEEAGILSAMILGDRSDLSPEIQTLYQGAGLSHILSVSGLHVSFWALLLGRGGGWLLSFIPPGGKRGRRLFGLLRFLLVGTALGFYMLMSGGRIPVRRAGLMALLAQLARGAGFSYDLPSALALSALTVLIPYPYALFQSSFQLSFGCIWLLGVLLPVLLERLRCESSGARALMVPVSLQMGMLPFTLHHYYCFYPYAVPVNLLVVPLAGFIMAGGLFSALAARVFLPAGMILGGPVFYLLRGIRLLCEGLASLPLSTMVLGHPDRAQTALYLLLVTGGLFLSFRIRRREWLRAALSLKESRQSRLSRNIQNIRKTALFLYFWTLGAAVVFLIRPPGELRITALAVGQGDCLLIELPGGVNYLVDPGGGSASSGERIILPYLRYAGIRRLEYVIVSHPDRDHINGLEALVEDPFLELGGLLLPYSYHGSEKQEALEEMARERQLNVFLAGAGDSWSRGEASFQVLYPGSIPLEEAENNDSLVILFRRGDFSLLLTGDLGESGEEQIIRHYGAQLQGISCLKVAHHGSRYSSSAAFLALIRPALALISCGKNNRYGHPATETLERLETVGARCLRTDRQGALCIKVPENDPLIIQTYHSNVEEQSMDKEHKTNRNTWIVCGIILLLALALGLILLRRGPEDLPELQQSSFAGESESEALSATASLPSGPAGESSGQAESWPVTVPASATAADTLPGESLPEGVHRNGGRACPEKDPGQEGFSLSLEMTDRLYSLFMSEITNNTEESDPFRSISPELKEELDALCRKFVAGEINQEALGDALKGRAFSWPSDPYQLVHELGEPGVNCYIFSGSDMELARQRILMTNRQGRHYLFLAVYCDKEAARVRIYMINALIY